MGVNTGTYRMKGYTKSKTGVVYDSDQHDGIFIESSILSNSGS